MKSWAPRPALLGLGLILTFSLVLGVVCLVQYWGSPFFSVPVVDEESYVEWGKRIAGGEVVGRELFYQDPLYPYFLGLVFRVWGENFTVVRVLQLLAGLASLVFVFDTGLRLSGPRAGLTAALVLALYRGLYFFALLLLKAELVIFFSALLCAAGVRASQEPGKSWWWLAAGMGLGLLCLLRGHVLLLCPFLLAWVWLAARRERAPRRFASAALFGAGILLPLLPVMVRNYAVGGELVLTTTQAGANFYLGNSEFATGRYVNLPFVRPNPRFEAEDFQREASRRAGRPLSRAEVSRFWFKEAFRWIRSHPQAAARLLLHKARLFVHNYEIPDNQSFYLLREHFVPALWVPCLGFGLLWGPALLGLGISTRRDRAAWFPALFALLYSLSIIPFFIVDRYRVAAAPAVAVFTALFLEWAAAKWRERKRVLFGTALLAAGSFLVSFLPTVESRSPRWGEYLLLADAYLAAGKPGPAVEWYGRVLRFHPENEEIFSRWAEAVWACRSADLPVLMAAAEPPDTTDRQLRLLAEKLQELGRTSEAEALLEKADRLAGP